MNYKIFRDITRIKEDGKVVGIPVNEKPDYKERIQSLRREFNKFTKEICPENWQLYKVGKYWQMGTPLGSTYKPYFWNQLKNNTYNIKGISVWLKIDINRLGIMFGTTKELDEYDKDYINDLIWGKYSNKEYKHFEKTHTDGYLNYNYIGDNEYDDLDIFKTAINDICTNYIDLVTYLKNNISTDDYDEKGFRDYLSKIAKQQDGKPFLHATINTYVTDLKTIIYILKKIEVYKNRNTNYILNDFLEKKDRTSTYLAIDFEQVMRNEDRRDTNLYKSITSKAKQYLKFIDWKNSQISKPIINIDEGENTIMRSTNIILYGPPGTGKTYKLQELQNNYDEYTTVTFHQSYGYEDFIEGLKAELNEDSNQVYYQVEDGVFKDICIQAQNNPDKQYAIFIDEINRGNISKIFGELITLIEITKRGMEITLPYSKELFSVPKNISIIGTMNTADRSIAVLDTALRRRFEFGEMMPDPYHEDISQDIKGINIQKMLSKMNKRIEFLYDRDHMIGHAYFINCNSFEALQKIFKNKIIPLLQEYFYDDWKKINLVLNNNNFVQSEKYTQSELFSNCEDFNEFEDDKIVYKLNFNALKVPENYRKIYE